MTSSKSSTARTILGLEEPWRSRFLIWVADRAGQSVPNKQLPTSEQVANWLDEQDIYPKVKALLAVWTGKTL